MNRYVAIFSIPARVIDQWVRDTPPEKRKALTEEMMEAWGKWMNDNARSVVDKGLPLGKTKRVTAKGITDARNELNFYVTVDAESHDDAARMLQTHPHLQIPEAMIEVMEVPAPPPM